LRKRQVLDEVPRDQLIDVHRRARPLRDRVRAVRIHHQIERLPEFHETIDEAFRALIVDVVVAGPMDDEQVPAQPFGEVDRGPDPVPVGVLLRDTHVAFLVDGVVEALVGHRRYRDADFVDIREAEHRVERVRAAAAPSPDADAIAIEVGVLRQQRAHRGRLFL
jgi:hypothetical protein